MSSNAYREGVAFALALGLTDEGINGEGHHVFRNVTTGESFSLSTTVRDGDRKLRNMKSDLRRIAGLSTRGREATEGERREKKKPTPDPERLAFEARRRAALRGLASREAAMAREAERARLAAAVEARRSELSDIERLMRQRPSGH